jgi:hypothetical protein
VDMMLVLAEVKVDEIGVRMGGDRLWDGCEETGEDRRRVLSRPTDRPRSARGAAKGGSRSSNLELSANANCSRKPNVRSLPCPVLSLDVVVLDPNDC